MIPNIEFDMKLLRFALHKSGISGGQYLIALSDEVSDEEDRTVLRRGTDGWEIYYCERGERVSRAFFERETDALKSFFWRLTNPTNPWSFREEFERSGAALK